LHRTQERVDDEFHFADHIAFPRHDAILRLVLGAGLS